MTAVGQSSVPAIQASGLFIMNKPAGFSSQQAITKLKKKLGIKKIGHAGTLDPFATGVLVCLVNAATKKADHFQAGLKTYSGIVKFGEISDSDDITGNVQILDCELPNAEKILAVLKDFHGKINQTPPRISAIKVNGMRAYQLERKGEAFELNSREVEIFESEFKIIDAQRLYFKIKTSKGFYVRSFARDLGEKLGCGALLESLCREASEPFSITEAKEIDSMQWSDLQDTSNFISGE